MIQISRDKVFKLILNCAGRKQTYRRSSKKFNIIHVSFNFRYDSYLREFYVVLQNGSSRLATETGQKGKILKRNYSNNNLEIHKYIRWDDLSD